MITALFALGLFAVAAIVGVGVGLLICKVVGI